MTLKYPQIFEPVVPTVAEIRRYTAKHAKLSKMHHFSYAIPINVGLNATSVEFVVMGINPGLSAETKRLTKEIMPLPSCAIFEESFLEDFQERTPKRASKSRSWRTTVSKLLDSQGAVLTETFLWASYKEGDLKGLLNSELGKKHLQFSKVCNDELFRAVSPRAIVLPGLCHAKNVVSLYTLKHEYTTKCEQTGHRLVEVYHDGTRPWFVTKHWSGSFGFSDGQRQAIQRTILSTP